MNFGNARSAPPTLPKSTTGCYNIRMNWALRRQLFYLGVFLAGVFLFGFLIIYPAVSKPPSCQDGKQNGEEIGIDCGGGCPIACTFEAKPISILWSRAFQVVPGRYNAVAYVENKNQNKAIHRISYRFRFADRDNLYIGMREGEIFIPPSGKFAIFEPAIDVGNSVPLYTTFEFTSEPVWINVPKEKVEQLEISVSDIRPEEGQNPRVFAKLSNNSLFHIRELGVVAILYDASGNAINVGSTYLEELAAEESREISFTWPEPFEGTVVAREIIPIYNILTAELR